MLLPDMPKRVTPTAFPARLVALRKERGLSQQALATAVNVHVNQVRRYEAGRSQPTLDVLRSLAKALRVSIDGLVFDAADRGPDDEFRMQFEALATLGKDERRIVKAVLDALLLQHDAKRWATA